jgi:hypothetical protein
MQYRIMPTGVFERVISSTHAHDGDGENIRNRTAATFHLSFTKRCVSPHLSFRLHVPPARA